MGPRLRGDDLRKVVLPCSRPFFSTSRYSLLRDGFVEVQDQRTQTGEAPRDMEELRDYGVGAQILTELGVHDMILLTNTHHSLVGLDAYGLSIVGERAIDLVDS